MKNKKILFFITTMFIFFFAISQANTISANYYPSNTYVSDNNYNLMGRTINVFNSTTGDTNDFLRAKDVVKRQPLDRRFIHVDDTKTTENKIYSG